jgi:hypothetical protein
MIQILKLLKLYIMGKLLKLAVLAFVIGMIAFGFGLDWDQSQITWKANASNAVMWIGGSIGVIGLIGMFGTWGKK